jgi:hypothetical protein
VTTSKATPSITTTPSAGGVVGTPIHDTATVSGGHSPTGTVTFALYAPGDTTCTGTNLVGGDSAFSNVPLAGATAVSPDHTTAQAGVYHWVATYNGDAANVSVTSGCADEPVAIGLAQPTIATIQLPRGGGPGAVIHDTATVTGGSDPTGTVTFRLYSPADSTCSGTPAFSDVEPLSGGNATSASTTATATGVYRWVATYNGDARNNVATSGCDEEPVVIVLGVTIHRPLPKTGTPVRSLLVTAVLFMAAGSALLLAGRLRWDPPSVSGMRHAIIAQALVVRGHIGASHRRRWGPPRRAGP